MRDYSTIGNLRAALSALDDQEAEVYIDNRPPTALSSYRGYYDHLAIERTERANEDTSIDEPGDPFDINLPGWGTYTPGSSEVKIKTPPTVAEMVKALDLADGATFEGYKGGQFTMDSGSELWVSDYGNCDRLRVVGVEVLPGRVDLVTNEQEW